ncbi:4Fe-4S dicluster domain-containing protein [Neobacillus novalis]|uniref:4Fe-4S dicluster domain-containing protein n=1 Tax=Neobacillus novalis TaxID=220687 RepID=UPI0008243296|nr:ferredoxin family protein [Neobacillus novalis]
MSLILNWLESLHADVKITEKCSRQRNYRSTCTVCAQACKLEAISFIERTLVIDSQRCNSCGDCIIACPLSAMKGLAVTREFVHTSLIYSEAYTPTEKELLIYKKRGLNAIQITDIPLNEQWVLALNETNRILKLLGEKPIEVVQNSKEEKLSRRALFSSLQKEGEQLARSMAPVSWKMEEDEWNLTKYYQDFQFYFVEMDQHKCTLCQACFSFCPQKVFRLEDSVLQIHHVKCVNCTACTDICPEEAIRIRPEIKGKSVTVESFFTKKCRDCGQIFSSFKKGKEKCHICVNRDPEWLSPY